MSIEENKAIVRRFVEEVWNKGDLTVIDDLFATNYVNHDPNRPEVLDPESYKQWVVISRTGFPDLHVTIEEMIAEGDKVATRWTYRGTHKGELREIPPTGRQVTVTGINIARIAGGKIEECWWNYDALGLMQQLGIIPTMRQGES